MTRANSAARPRLWSRLAASALGALGALALLSITVDPSPAAGAAIRVTTDQGAWLIETQDPQVEVRVGQNGRTVTISDGSEGRQITFDTQTHRLRIGPDQEIEVSLDESQPFNFRRDGQVIVTVRRVSPAAAGDGASDGAGDGRPAPAGRKTPTERTVDPAGHGPGQRLHKVTLFAVARDGRLMGIEVRGRDVQVTPLLRLPVPFRTHAGLTEGLAMGPDGRLYAAVNMDVNFLNKSAATGQGGQGAESLLYCIDLQTGEAERVGGIGHRQVDGLSLGLDGKLYGVTSILGGGDGARLLRIDQDTGRARTVAADLPLGDLDCIEVISKDRALVVDGMGLRDAFYEIRLDGRAVPRRLAATPNIIPHSRDLEGLALGQDGFLYAFTGPDAGPDARVHLLRIDPKTFEHTDLGLMEFGAYCLAAETGAAPVRPAAAPATSSNRAAETPAIAEKVEKVAAEPTASLTVAVTGPRLAGLPLQFELGIANTGSEPIYYWCGGPARYPGAHPFRVAVTDGEGHTRMLPLSNGQYVQGSGTHHSIQTVQTLPAVCDPLPAGTYTLTVTGARSGYLKDGQKIVTWPAMAAEPITVRIEEDPQALREAERKLLAEADADPFARHIVKTYGIDPIVMEWLNQLRADDWHEARKNVGRLMSVRRLPPGGEDVLKQAVAQHLHGKLDSGREGFLRNVAIMARNVGTEGCIEAMAMMAKSDGSAFFRNAVVDDLAGIRHPQAEKVLMELAEDEDSPVYWHALRGLARQHNEAALEPLLEATRSDDSDRRAFAVSALWGLRDLPAARQALLRRALTDPDPEVRRWAKHSLTSETYGLSKPF